MTLEQLIEKAKAKGWQVQRLLNPTPNQCGYYYRLVQADKATRWHGYWSNLVAFVERSAGVGGDYDMQYGYDFSNSFQTIDL